jgi:tetraacyldisaccharide 4'-kinase
MRALHWFAGLLYRLGYLLHRKAMQNLFCYDLKNPKIPLVAVSSLRAGGGGKTPVVCALAKHFIAKGAKVAVVVTPVYGCKKKWMQWTGATSLVEVSDEGAMLASYGLDVFSGNKRKRVLEHILALGYDLIILDGAEEDYRIQGLKRLWLDSGEPKSFTELLPLGPWRSFYKDHSHQDLRVSVARSKETLADVNLQTYGPFNFIGQLPHKLPWGVVVGIGDPTAFIQQMCKAIEGTPKFIDVLPDHSPRLLGQITKRLREGMGVVCTLKDAIKLPQSMSHHPRLFIAQVEVHWSQHMILQIESYVGFKT